MKQSNADIYNIKYVSLKAQYEEILEKSGVNIYDLTYKWYSYLNTPVPQYNDGVITVYNMSCLVHHKSYVKCSRRSLYLNLLNNNIISNKSPKLVEYNIIYDYKQKKYIIDPNVISKEVEYKNNKNKIC